MANSRVAGFVGEGICLLWRPKTYDVFCFYWSLELVNSPQVQIFSQLLKKGETHSLVFSTTLAHWNSKNEI